MSQRCFNSIKVRLKHLHCRYLLAHFPTFQFHKGPIKADRTPLRANTLTRFQFHKGPIKAKLILFGIKLITLFQFHKGPIKATL